VFEANSAFKHLRGPSRFVWSELEWSGPKPICSASCDGSQLRYEAIACSEKAPFYTGSPANGRAGSVLAYRIIDGHTPKSLLYVPVVRELSEPLIAAASRCDCLIFDGTFWSVDEMSATGTGVASAQTMGIYRSAEDWAASSASAICLHLEKSIPTSTTRIQFSTSLQSSDRVSGRPVGRSQSTECSLKSNQCFPGPP